MSAPVAEQSYVRTFTPELQVRSSSQGGDGRTIEGLAVPYGVPQRIDDVLVEQFARGAFNHQLRAAARVWFAREHVTHGGTVIGKAVELRDDPAGLWGAWRVSRTPIGDETLELVRDGVLDNLSIGFRERQNRRLQDGVIERVKADLLEVSVVLMGAYGEGATVSDIRHAGATHICCPCVGATRSAEAAEILASLPVLPARQG